MDGTTISDHEFSQLREWIHEIAGIHFTSAKKALVCSRLAKRLRHHQLSSYGDYFRLLVGGQHPQEVQTAVDLLTTNETYFFREPKHFQFLRDRILPNHPSGRPLRIWSAASSYGQEAYSIAMTLAWMQGQRPWEVVASDISLRVLDQCRGGQYPLEQAGKIPTEYLAKYCLKGIGTQEGTFMIDAVLRKRVSFHQVNLTMPLPHLGEFDVIFLRNVMIYFDAATKQQVVGRVLSALKQSGHLMIGRSESLNGVTDGLRSIAPSVYVKL